MNEPEFADLLSKILNDMLDGVWEKGQYTDKPGIEVLQ